MGKPASMPPKCSCPCLLFEGKHQGLFVGADATPEFAILRSQLTLSMQQSWKHRLDCACQQVQWRGRLRKAKCAHLHTPRIEAHFLSNLPAFLQAKLLALVKPCLLTVPARNAISAHYKGSMIKTSCSLSIKWSHESHLLPCWKPSLK